MDAFVGHERPPHRLVEQRVDVAGAADPGRHVGAGEDRDDAGQRERVGELDRADHRVGDGRPDVREKERVGELDVFDVRAADSEHPRVLDSQDPVAQNAAHPSTTSCGRHLLRARGFGSAR